MEKKRKKAKNVNFRHLILCALKISLAKFRDKDKNLDVKIGKLHEFIIITMIQKLNY